MTARLRGPSPSGDGPRAGSPSERLCMNTQSGLVNPGRLRRSLSMVPEVTPMPTRGPAGPTAGARGAGRRLKPTSAIGAALACLLIAAGCGGGGSSTNTGGERASSAPPSGKGASKAAPTSPGTSKSSAQRQQKSAAHPGSGAQQTRSTGAGTSHAQQPGAPATKQPSAGRTKTPQPQKTSQSQQNCTLMFGGKTLPVNCQLKRQLEAAAKNGHAPLGLPGFGTGSPNGP
jgi:hypothetical protein